jgi:hypothetical protein
MWGVRRSCRRIAIGEKRISDTGVSQPGHRTAISDDVDSVAGVQLNALTNSWCCAQHLQLDPKTGSTTSLLTIHLKRQGGACAA